MGKSRKRTKLSHTTGYPYKTARPSSEKGAVQFHEHASFAGIAAIFLALTCHSA